MDSQEKQPSVIHAFLVSWNNTSAMLLAFAAILYTNFWLASKVLLTDSHHCYITATLDLATS